MANVATATWRAGINFVKGVFKIGGPAATTLVTGAYGLSILRTVTFTFFIIIPIILGVHKEIYSVWERAEAGAIVNLVVSLFVTISDAIGGLFAFSYIFLPQTTSIFAGLIVIYLIVQFVRFVKAWILDPLVIFIK